MFPAHTEDVTSPEIPMDQKPPHSSKPSKTEVLLQKAHSLKQSGRLAEAMRFYNQVLALQSDNLEACYGMGKLYEQQNQPQAAINWYFQALAIRYNFLPAHSALGLLFLQLGDIKKAISSYQQALAFDANASETHFNLGCAYQVQGNLELAIQHYRKAIALKPDFVNAHVNLGVLYKSLDQLEEAASLYRSALAIDPQCLQVLCNFALIFEIQGDLATAELYFRKALAIQADYEDGIAGCALILEKRGDYLSAYHLLLPLVETGGSAVGSVINFASVCARLGRAMEAIPYVQYSLNAPALTANECVLLLFKLGDLYESLSQYDDAFSAYQQANTLSAPNFQPERWVQDTDNLISAFSVHSFSHFPKVKNPSELPIFIVGMPRSGTSLVEQILASHPQVFGGGELPDMFLCAQSLPIEQDKYFPFGLEEVSAETWEEIASRYLEKLQARAPKALRITDKLPLNYLHIGLIHQLFPKAKIIHCRRNPLDTCLSCYFQNFGTRIPFSSNLEHLGLAYRQYERLMNHWQSLNIPILNVQYESLIAQPETVSRALVDFCSLEWDERCLRFYETKRFINTASYDQARQPIYERSIGRARHYEKHLQILRNLLEV
jgi:tetratricopeptide (TPR) repeat protein